MERNTITMERAAIPKTLRRLRLMRNITQEKMAEVLGVSYGTIGRLESGETGLSLARARQYADYFGISLDELSGRPTGSVEVVKEDETTYKALPEASSMPQKVKVVLEVTEAKVHDQRAEAFVQKLREAIQEFEEEGDFI